MQWYRRTFPPPVTASWRKSVSHEVIRSTPRHNLELQNSLLTGLCMSAGFPLYRGHAHKGDFEPLAMEDFLPLWTTPLANTALAFIFPPPLFRGGMKLYPELTETATKPAQNAHCYTHQVVLTRKDTAKAYLFPPSVKPWGHRQVEIIQETKSAKGWFLKVRTVTEHETTFQRANREPPVQRCASIYASIPLARCSAFCRGRLIFLSKQIV